MKLYRTQLSIQKIMDDKIECFVAGYPQIYRVLPSKFLPFKPELGKIFHTRVAWYGNDYFIMANIEKE